MKTLQFIYQETEINFSINPLNKNVMINATEMAKAFGKRIDVFLKADHTKNFIEKLEISLNEFTPYGGNSEMKIIETRGQSGTYMNRKLALKFAAWLDVEFELWVFDKIDEILFGNYQKHWESHAAQESARINMALTKQKMIENPTEENVRLYFLYDEEFKNAKKNKTKAIRNQLALFKEVID